MGIKNSSFSNFAPIFVNRTFGFLHVESQFYRAKPLIDKQIFDFQAFTRQFCRVLMIIIPSKRMHLIAKSISLNFSKNLPGALHTNKLMDRFIKIDRTWSIPICKKFFFKKFYLQKPWIHIPFISFSMVKSSSFEPKNTALSFWSGAYGTHPA